MSYTMDSRDLKALSEDPAVPITSQGRAPHKVWVIVPIAKAEGGEAAAQLQTPPPAPPLDGRGE